MEPNIETLFLQLESDPDLSRIKQQLRSLEAQIQPRVSEDVWLLLLRWEAEWAQYLTMCAKHIYPLAYQAGLQATGQQDPPAES